MRVTPHLNLSGGQIDLRVVDVRGGYLMLRSEIKRLLAQDHHLVANHTDVLPVLVLERLLIKYNQIYNGR